MDDSADFNVYEQSFAPELPPEIIEAILENIEDDSTLLNCRLVNYSWKSVVGSILEKRRLAHWLNDDLETSFRRPTLRAVFWGPLSPTVTHFTIPSVFNNITDGNPFPNNSLLVMGFPVVHPWCSHIKECPKMKLVNFFQNFGHFLTSLTLHKLRLSSSDFELVLLAVPNLKALTLSAVKIIPALSLSSQVSLPQLTSLQILTCEQMLINCVLSSVSTQLVSLKLLKISKFEICSLQKHNFMKLRTLIVIEDYNYYSSLLTTILAPSLEYLAFVDKHICNPPSFYTRNDMARKIRYILPIFYASISRLRVSISGEDLAEMLEEINIVFMNLKLIEIANWGGESCDKYMVKQVMLHWCPKLETVKVISQWGSDPDKTFDDDNCRICEKLANPAEEPPDKNKCFSCNIS